MVGGNADIFMSRRTNFLKCEYWNVIKQTTDKNTLVNETQSTGTFFAKIENNTITNGANIIGQVFMFDSNNMTLSTNDNVCEMKKNAVVRIDGIDGLWRVDSVEKTMLRSNYQYHLFSNCKTVISIRR